MTIQSKSTKRDFSAVPAEVETIPEFCVSNRISKSFFYKLVRQGKGPRLMKVGKRTLIRKEASAEWRREGENRTAEIKAHDGQ